MKPRIITPVARSNPKRKIKLTPVWDLARAKGPTKRQALWGTWRKDHAKPSTPIVKVFATE